MNIISAIKARASTRAFLPQAVSPEHLEAILEAARWAPSGKNTQPWYVAVVSGETQKRISEALLKVYRAGEPQRPDYQYYSKEISPQFHERAFACGMALYQALGIAREDKERRSRQWELNYQFFAAPAAFFIFVDRNLAQGSWMDMGMFIQNIMLAAEDFGLATCPQASLAEYPDLVREILGETYRDKLVVCGISIGYADKTKSVNNYRTAREEVAAFSKWFI